MINGLGTSNFKYTYRNLKTGRTQRDIIQIDETKEPDERGRCVRCL